MNHVNRPLLIISLATVAILGVSAFFLNRFQVSRHRGFYFDRALESREAGDLPRAIEQFRLAIQLGKRDYETHSELAQTWMKVPNPQGAYLEALRAEGYEANHLENHRLLAESAMMAGQFNDVQTWANKLLDARPNDPEFLLMRARGRFGDNEYSTAAEDYEQVLRDPSASVDVFVELATLYADRLNAFARGREIIDRLIQTDPIPAAHLIAHGNWCLVQHARRSISATFVELQQIEELRTTAAQEAQTALTLYPEDPSAHTLAIRSATSNRQFERAVVLGEQALERFPDQRELYVSAAAAAIDAENQEKATELLIRGLRRYPQDRDLLWHQANLQIELKNYEQAAEAVGKLEQSGTPLPKVRYMQARLLAAQNKYLNAIKEFETARTDLVNFPELQRLIDLELAKCFDGIGDRAGQILALRRAAGQNSSFLAAREQLAIALLAAGRVDAATAEYRDLAAGEQAPAGAVLNLARLIVLQNQARKPSRRDWSQVDAILDQVEKLLGPQQEIAVIRAESLMARDRVDEARQILAAQPPNDVIYSARILLEANQRQWQKADELIEAAQQEGFDSVELRRSRAIRSLFANEPDQEQRLTSLLAAPESWTPEQIAELEKEMLPIALSAELDNLTLSIASSILNKDPTYVAARFSTLATQLRQKDSVGMRATLNELEKISGRNSVWNYGQALTYVLAEDPKPDDLDRAQELLNNACALRPDWAEALALSGMIYDRQKNTEGAIAAYAQAVRLGWRRTQEARRLIDLLSEKGRFGEADAAIRRLSQASPALSSSMSGNPSETSWMSRKASEISWRLDDLQRAVEKAEEAANASQDAGDYLWLSQVRLINKDNKGAELALQRAMELEADNPNIQSAWISFLLRNSRMDEALQAALQLEAQTDPTVPLQMLRMVEIYRLLGKTDDQHRILASIDLGQLRSLEEFQRYYTLSNDRPVQLRQQFLERLISAESTHPDPEITRWARRQLAIELINLPEGPQFDSARALVVKNLESDSKSIEDRRIKAMIVAVQYGTTKPSEAIALFQELLQESWIPNPEEQFLLGQLHIANGDWTEGSRYFTRLLDRAEDRNPEHLKRYIRLLLGHKAASEAELWLDVLRRDGVQDVETGVLLAEIRFQRGQFDPLIRDLLAQDISYPETAWFQATVPLRRRFELLNLFATRLKLDGNDRVYDKFVAASERLKPDLESSADFPGVFYATQLLARKEYKNSLTALEQAINLALPTSDSPTSVSSDELVGFTDTFLASPEVPSDQAERLEALLLKADPTESNPVLPILVARLREIRGDYSAAERIYRELLVGNPNDAVALNNLANLLALKRTKGNEAVQFIERAIALMGETPMLLDTRAVCNLAAGNLAAARKDMESAVALYPHPLLRFHLAQTLYEAREFGSARQEFDRALAAGLQRSMLHILEQPQFDRMVRDLQVELSPP